MQNLQELLTRLEPLYPVLLVGMWLFISFTMSRTSGWSDLARVHPEPKGMARTPVWSFWRSSVGMRAAWLPLSSSYGGCVSIQVAATGLHLRMWPIFRFGHPPVFVPWADVETMAWKRFLIFRSLVVHPRGVGTRIHLSGAPARAVEEVYGQWAAQARAA
jgi:hypothetical protein